MPVASRVQVFSLRYRFSARVTRAKREHAHRPSHKFLLVHTSCCLQSMPAAQCVAMAFSWSPADVYHSFALPPALNVVTPSTRLRPGAACAGTRREGHTQAARPQLWWGVCKERMRLAV